MSVRSQYVCLGTIEAHSTILNIKFSRLRRGDLGKQQYLEAPFSTIAVYQASVFLVVEDDRVSTITVCLPGCYRGSQYFSENQMFAPPAKRF